MTTAECLFACIRYTVFGVQLTQEEKAALSEVSFEALYHLSALHDLAHLICEALKQNGMLPDDEWGRAFQKQKDLAVFRYIKQNDAYTEVCRILEEAEVPYVPLKGTVIRDYYPDSWMRTSCDIDILIHEEHLDRVSSVLTDSLHCVQGSRDYHDISFHLPDGVHLELHFHIKEALPMLDDALSQVWNYVEPGLEKPLCCHMTNEFFVFHQLAHMFYHFVEGGCGLRPFIDCGLLMENMTWDQEKLDVLLKQSGLCTFAEVVFSLNRKWFGGEICAVPGEDRIMRYILRGGAYGSQEKRVASQQIRRGSTSKNIINRIWLPYDILKNYYTALEKRPYLLPAYQIHRWLKIISQKERRQRSIRELRQNVTSSDQEREEMKEIFDYLGLTEQYHDA